MGSASHAHLVQHQRNKLCQHVRRRGLTLSVCMQAPNQPGHQDFNQNFRGGHPRGRGRGARGGFGGGGGLGGGGGFVPGDWTCPNCSVKVFASRDACFRCSTPRPHQGAFSGPFSGGPPRREGDWTGPTCNANVYSTRTACFRCSAPKPANAEDSSFGEAAAFENQQMDSRAGLPAGGVIAANR